MLLSDLGEQPVPGHVGFLAGRYRDGAYSDIWTDVSRCAEGTFMRYASACTCGWRGAAQLANPVAWTASRTLWQQHLAEIQASTQTQARPPVAEPSSSGRAPRRTSRTVVPGNRA